MAKRPAARPRHVDPTVGPLAERPLPEIAKVLRSRIKPILRDCEKMVRQHVPPANGATVQQVLDGLPDILGGMADALAAGKAAHVTRLMARSPEQGIHRFQMHYDVRQLATEDRMLRRTIADHVEDALGRRTTRAEDAALHWVIDLMAQQAMIAFVEHQNRRLRDAAEAELKYLSFLSHDLNGNLGNVTLWLQILRRALAESPQFTREVAALDEAQQAILTTMGGMGRLLQAERLRHSGVEPEAGPLNLYTVASESARQSAQTAEQKGLALVVEVPPDAKVTSDGAMVRLVLQNLIGNAVKYSSRGTVRVRAERAKGGAWSLAVSDEGPGIAPEAVGHIFQAFRRGEMHGQQGVGLGLAIASRAAKLLKAELTVESKVGVGSTFRLAFAPDASR